MARYYSYVDSTVGLGNTTVQNMLSNGSEYGVVPSVDIVARNITATGNFIGTLTSSDNVFADLKVTGIATIGIVTGATYYGDGSNLSGVGTFSGDYNDLSNKPTIPTNNNELTNGAGYITNSVTGDFDVSGNFGLGTTNPQTINHIFGGDPILRIQDSSTPIADAFAAIQLAETVSGGGLGNYWQIALEGDSSTSSDHLTFKDGTSERMRLDSDGRLLIGTTSDITGISNRKLQVVHTDGAAVLSLGRNDSSIGTNNTLGKVEVYGNEGGTYHDIADITFAAAASHTSTTKPTKIVFSTTPSGSTSSLERMTIDSSGNVGVGTATPDTTLRVTKSTVSEAAQTNDIAVFERNDNGYIKLYSANNKVGGLAFGDPDDAFIGAIRYNHDGDYMDFYVNNSERLRINSSGNVGINDNNPVTKLDVNGDIGIREGNNLVWHDTNGVAAFRIRAGSDNILHFERASGNEQNLTIDDGNVGLGTASPGDYLASAHQLVIYDAASTGITIATPTSSSGTIAFADGTGVADNARGLIRYGHSDNSLQFSTNAGERMRIDSSGRLLVGLTATQSDAYLEVKPDIDRANSVVVWGQDTTSEYVGLGIMNGDAVVSAGGAGSTSNELVFRVSTSGTEYEAMRIDSSGRLGIGRIPTAKFDIDVNGVALHIGYGSDYDNYFTSGSSGITVFRAGSTERMRIDSSGRMGIGVNNPGSYYGNGDDLVIGGGASHGITIKTGTTHQGIIAFADGTSGGSQQYAGYILYDHATDHVQFATGASERMRLDSIGRLLVGTNTVRTGNIHHIESTSSDTTLLVTKNNSTAAHIPLAVYHTATSGNNSLINFYTDGGNFRGSIGYNRTTNQVSYNTTSDIRLKQNIVDAPSAINLVSQIRVRSFDWIEEGHDTVNYGYVAQELNEVFPTAVSVGDSGDEVEQTWGVSNSALVPVLTKALQEAMERIESLEAKVAALESE